MSKIQYTGPSVLADNEIDLLLFIMMILKYSDCCFDILIDKNDERTICHISPSNPDFKQDIIDNLLYVNKITKKKVIVFSKSLAISKKISFSIQLN